MAERLQLQNLLEDILGSPNVYFQPPLNVQMIYPCFVYHLDDYDTKFAGNMTYRLVKRYRVTYIDKNPDSEIPEIVANLPLVSFNRFFVADKLNHFVFNLYF